jgi:hypothetical protein
MISANKWVMMYTLNTLLSVLSPLCCDIHGALFVFHFFSLTVF